MTVSLKRTTPSQISTRTSLRLEVAWQIPVKKIHSVKLKIRVRKEVLAEVAMYDEDTSLDDTTELAQYPDYAQGYTQSNWTPEEDDQLRELILVKRLSNWERIAEAVKKSPKDCCKRYGEPLRTLLTCYSRWNTIRPPHHFEVTERRKWTPAEDNQLIKLVEKYGTRNWRIIGTRTFESLSHSSFSFTRTPSKTMSRTMGKHLYKSSSHLQINHVDPDISKGRLNEEDWLKVLEGVYSAVLL